MRKILPKDALHLNVKKCNSVEMYQNGNRPLTNVIFWHLSYRHRVCGFQICMSKRWYATSTLQSIRGKRFQQNHFIIIGIFTTLHFISQYASQRWIKNKKKFYLLMRLLLRVLTQAFSHSLLDFTFRDWIHSLCCRASFHKRPKNAHYLTLRQPYPASFVLLEFI